MPASPMNAAAPPPDAAPAGADAAADAAFAWHTVAADDVARRLGSSVDAGLAASLAAEGLAKHGPNELREQAPRSAWAMLLGQFTDFMIVLLIVAAAVSGLIGEVADALVILAVVVLNGIVGFIQERRAEEALRSLKQLAALKACVVRDGAARTIPAADLVSGDLMLLEAGSAVPADLRPVAVATLRVEEAALTGESHPVEKRVDALPDAALPIGDRLGMGYAGTVVTYGRGSGLVAATGMATEIGRIAALLAGTAEVRTPLWKRLATFGRQLSAAALAVCVLVFTFGMLRGEPVALMFLTAVSLAVVAVPEALPAVVTVCLALGAQRMGAQERARAPPARGGDARLGDMHLLGQDRHAGLQPQGPADEPAARA